MITPHFVFFCLAVISSVSAFEKTYIIKGSTTCFDEPAADVLVEMKYFDTVHKGEVLATVTTDEEGNFAIKASGDTSDFVNNDFKVYLEFSSTCDREKREGCHILTAVNVPSSKEGEEYEMKTIRLDRRPVVINSCDEGDDGY